MQEIKTRTLPPPPQWRAWQIHRDFNSLLRKLDHEFRQARGESQGKAGGTKLPVYAQIAYGSYTEIVKKWPELVSPTDKAVWEW
ncbi:unnamed protein product, partial [marine sediment metagenome]